MDGYAVDVETLSGSPPFELEVVGDSLAGHPYHGDLLGGQCIRITTGAAVPDCCNAVVIQENCERNERRLKINVTVSLDNNIRAPGNDVRRDEPIVAGRKLINAFDVGWLAASGISEINVFRKPRVAIFSTGDELREPGQSLSAGQIYDANRYALSQLLSTLPVDITDLGIIPDDPDAIREALLDASPANDLLLTTGGVSVGDADYVREVVAQVGRIDLWRLNLKPGKPLAYGWVGDTLFLGLPGNPVSTIVTYLLIAKPVITELAGSRFVPQPRYPARLEHKLPHNPGREEYQRGRLFQGADGLTVSSQGDQSSNRLASFSGADCLIRVPKDAGDLEAGSIAEVLPLGILMN